MSEYTLMPKGSVKRNSDGAFIPKDAGNIDWDKYLAWRAAGGIPDPCPPDLLLQSAMLG